MFVKSGRQTKLSLSVLVALSVCLAAGGQVQAQGGAKAQAPAGDQKLVVPPPPKLVDDKAAKEKEAPVKPLAKMSEREKDLLRKQRYDELRNDVEIAREEEQRATDELNRVRNAGADDAQIEQIQLQVSELRENTQKAIKKAQEAWKVYVYGGHLPDEVLGIESKADKAARAKKARKKSVAKRYKDAVKDAQDARLDWVDARNELTRIANLPVVTEDVDDTALDLQSNVVAEMYDKWRKAEDKKNRLYRLYLQSKAIGMKKDTSTKKTAARQPAAEKSGTAKKAPGK